MDKPFDEELQEKLEQKMGAMATYRAYMDYKNDGSGRRIVSNTPEYLQFALEYWEGLNRWSADRPPWA